MKSKIFLITSYTLLGVLLFAGTVYLTRLVIAKPKPVNTVSYSHIVDEAHILDDPHRMNPYLEAIYGECDVDIRLVFLRNLGGRAIEEVANDKVKELHVGSQSRDDRGVLILFDLADQKFRIEVGYALEEYFPDAFISYLINNHTKEFFASGDISVGLRLMIRIMHHRIREAVLGRKFDPSILVAMTRGQFLSGGAGATGVTPIRHANPTTRKDSLSATARGQFIPQSSPEAAYQTYVEWAQTGIYDPNVTLFTKETREFLNTLQMSKAYFDLILLQEFGRKTKMLSREGLAMLFYTDDPLNCPHFFVKSDSGWQMDIGAELRNTMEITGGDITWTLTGSGDNYSTTFADQIIQFAKVEGGWILRMKDGDNRLLPTRSTSGNLAQTANASSREEQISRSIEENLPPYLKGVLASIKSEKFDSVYRLYAELQRNYEKTPADESELDLALDLIFQTNVDIREALDHFVSKYPHSFVPHLLKGTYLANLGSKARGTRAASETSDAQFETMTRYYNQAMLELDSAIRINPKLIHAYAYEILCLVKYSNQRGLIEEIYQKGIAHNPLSFKLRSCYLTILEPKWGGSLPEMEQFVAQAEQQSMKNSLLLKLRARINSSLGDAAWFREDFEEAARYYQLAASDGNGMYRDRAFYMLGYGYARKEDYVNAKKYFNEAIQARPTAPDSYELVLKVMQLETQ